MSGLRHAEISASKMRDKRQALEPPNSQRCIMMFTRASFHRPVTEATVLRKFAHSFLWRRIYGRKISDVFSFPFNVKAWSRPIRCPLNEAIHINTHTCFHLSHEFLTILFLTISDYIFSLRIFIRLNNFHRCWHNLTHNCQKMSFFIFIFTKKKNAKCNK